jgi:hypothetical protein
MTVQDLLEFRKGLEAQLEAVDVLGRAMCPTWELRLAGAAEEPAPAATVKKAGNGFHREWRKGETVEAVKARYGKPEKKEKPAVAGGVEMVGPKVQTFGQRKRTGLAELVREYVAGRQTWFDTGELRRWIGERDPKRLEGDRGLDVTPLLLHLVQKGELETEGTGRERRYRRAQRKGDDVAARYQEFRKEVKTPAAGDEGV